MNLNPAGQTRILIVAASAVVRAGLESLLGSSPALHIVGSVPSSALQPVSQDPPDVLLVEVERGELTPLVATMESLPVVLLMAEPEEDRAIEALRRGARAVLPRDAGREEIVAAIAAAAHGLIALHPDVAGFLEAMLASAAQRPDAPVESLTPREIEVLGMLAEGAGNKGIAHRLGISEHTVKFHVGSILAKLEASSRTEAVTVGIRQGLIML